MDRACCARTPRDPATADIRCLNGIEHAWLAEHWRLDRSPVDRYPVGVARHNRECCGLHGADGGADLGPSSGSSTVLCSNVSALSPTSGAAFVVVVGLLLSSSPPLAAALVTLVLATALTHALYWARRDRPPDIATAYRRSLRRYPSLPRLVLMVALLMVLGGFRAARHRGCGRPPAAVVVDPRGLRRVFLGGHKACVLHPSRDRGAQWREPGSRQRGSQSWTVLADGSAVCWSWAWSSGPQALS